MSRIEVVLSLNLVGPREGLAERDKWPFCLRLSASYDGEPVDADPAVWARALLPWTLFPSAPTGEASLRAYLFSGVPNDEFLQDMRDIDVSPVTEWPAFTEDLREELAHGLEENLSRYSFSLTPSQTVTEVIDDADAAMPLVFPVAGVLQGIADLPPALSQSLHASWYFTLPREWLDRATGEGARLGVVPLRLYDQRQNATLHLESQPVAISPLHRFLYHQDGTGLEAFASGPGVSLSALRAPSADPAADPRETYWLPVTDNRVEALEELDARLGRALDPRSLVTAVPLAALAAALTVEPPDVDRRALAKVLLQRARQFWEAEEPTAGQPGAQETLARLERERSAEILKSLRVMPAGADPMAWVRSALASYIGTWWTFTWPDHDPDAPWPVRMLNAARLDAFPDITALGIDAVAPIVEACLPIIWPASAAVAPSLPNEGIHLRIGGAHEALLHEDHPDAGNEGDAAQIAAIGLLVRRAPDVHQFPTRPWRLVTSNVAVLDTPKDDDPGLRGRPFGAGVVEGLAEPLPHTEPLIRGLPTTFVNSILRNEVTYRGEHPGAPSPLRFGHSFDGTAEGAADLLRLAPLSWEVPGALGAAFPEIAQTRAPALRYGDTYEFAAFVVDRVGGVPHALVDQQFGTHGVDSYDIPPDWGRLTPDLEVRRSTSLTFRRRVPVGEVNILGDGAWPALPAGVTLRSREWHDAQLKGTDNISVLLLGDPQAFTGVADAYTFRVEPPRLDEFTLSRWCMPPIGSSPGSEEGLAGELRRIFEARDRLQAMNPTPEEAQAIAKTLLPHDPAVSAIGVSIHRVDAEGEPRIERHTVRLTRPDPFHADALKVTVTRVPAGGGVNHLVVHVPDGSFCRLDLRPLVLAADYTRFEDAVFVATSEGRAPLVEEAAWVADGDIYRAFAPTRVLVESALMRLPDGVALYDGLVLEADDRGRVRVEFDAGRLPGVVAHRVRRDLAFVDSFTLVRTRWMWRNLPLVDPTTTPPSSGDEGWPDWQRRMGGGIPRELWDTAQRDVASEVLRFDDLVSIDRGFVDRGAYSSRWPRNGAAIPAARAVLLFDDRDGTLAADYLRYGLRARSRYASIIRNAAQREGEARQVGTALEPDRRWRRVVAPFRGKVEELKPLRVLCVLPMTRAPGATPFDGMASTTATPFLVVLDEVWYRENGHEEGVEAYVDLEAIEATQTTAPYRAAPLPDHHVSPAGSGERPYFRGLMDAPSTGSPAVPLAVFGPFGYTLDRADSESLANATGFVVYPPADVGPHWWMGVRLRRVLRTPDADQTVTTVRAPRASDIHHLYTLPGHLAEVAAGGSLTLRVGGGIEAAGVQLHLTPVPQPDPVVQGQYRYVLLLGPSVFDGSRGTDLFLPRHAVWLDAGAVTPRWSTLGLPLPPGWYTGRVAEVLLNGRYTGLTSVLDEARDLRDLLKKMLPTAEQPLQDSPGAMRRISDEFRVLVE